MSEPSFDISERKLSHAEYHYYKSGTKFFDTITGLVRTVGEGLGRYAQEMITLHAQRDEQSTPQALGASSRESDPTAAGGRVGDFDWERAARELFQLLDNVDTLDDIAKSDDDAYREGVREQHTRRFQILKTDGYGNFELKGTLTPGSALLP